MLHVLPFCQQIGPVEHVYPRGTATTYYQDKPFVFQALTWNLVTTGSLTDQNDEKETASENRESYVFVTGTTETELSCSLRVPVEPWFMMKLGRVDDDDETPWSQQELDTFLQDYYLTRRTYDEEEHKTVTKEHHRTYSVKENNKKYRVTYKSALERTEVVYQYDYDAGFTGPQPKKFQFLKLYWKTDRAKKSAAYLCTNEKLVEDLKKEQGLTIKPYEGALETTIRLMHDTNCTSTGWMQVNPGYYVFDRRRQPVLKTAVRLKLKKTHDFASAMEPYLPYQDKKEVGIRMCSFDLETYSSTGKFPNPKVDGDTIFQISCYFKDFGKSETWTVLLHLKHMDPLRHKQYTGLSNELILSNLEKLDKLDIPIEIRMPIIPGLNDSADNLSAASQFLSKMQNIERIKLLPYHRLGEGKYGRLDMKYELSNTEPPNKERMEQLTELMMPHIPDRISVTSG